MRVIAVLPLLLASPALAAPAEHRAPVRPNAEQAMRALGDPLAQEVAARTLTQLVGIVLDTRVGPAAALTDPEERIRPTDTLRDLAQRDDPRFEEHLYQNTRRSLGTAAAVAGGAAAEARELKRTADRLNAALAPLVGMLSADER
jgi:hypothetical protein